MLLEDKILSFVHEMGYLNNEHVLGLLFYGSYLTGFNNENSDIDLHIVFDNEDPNHLIRGNKVLDGTRIEYFEKGFKIKSFFDIIEKPIIFTYENILKTILL